MQNINLTNEDKSQILIKANYYIEYFKRQSALVLQIMEFKHEYLQNQDASITDELDTRTSKRHKMYKNMKLNHFSPNMDYLKISLEYMDSDSPFDYSVQSSFSSLKKSVYGQFQKDFLTNISAIIYKYICEKYTSLDDDEMAKYLPNNIKNHLNYNRILKDSNNIFDGIQSWWNHISQGQDLKNYCRRWQAIHEQREIAQYINKSNEYLKHDFFYDLGSMSKSSKRVISFKNNRYNNFKAANTLLFYISRFIGYDAKKNNYFYEDLNIGNNEYNYGIIKSIRLLNQRNHFSITFVDEKIANAVFNELDGAMLRYKIAGGQAV